MNNRIEQLQKQAGLQPYYPSQEGDIKKFAELIVAECAEWINNNIGLVDEAAQADLLKHFGVNL